MSEEARRERWWMLGAWISVALCLFVGLLPILAPGVPSEDDPNAISVDRAMEHVEFIAQEPHVMGTLEIERVRDYLVTTLTEMGLEPETMTIETPDYFGSSGGTVEVVDVLARIPGAGDGEAVLLMAHYDTVPTTSGANDNAVAVAALLEAARELSAGPPPPNDVIILLTDGEEPTPRYGAWGFAEFHPWFADVALAVNFEGIGVAGPSMLVELSGPSGELIYRLAKAVADPVAFSFMTQTADIIGGAATDFDVFRDRDVPGYNFAYMRGSSIYHTPRDAIDAVNVKGLAHHGSLALDIARNLDLEESVYSDWDDAIFFTVPGGLVIQYSSVGAAVGVLTALLLVGYALWLRVSRPGSSVRALLGGTGLVIAAALGIVVAASVVWFGLVNLRGDMGPTEGYIYLTGLVGLAGAGWYQARRWSAARGSDLVGGVLIVWLVLAVTVGLFVQAIGYLFVWPAMAIGAAELLAARRRGYVARLVSVVIVAVTTFVVLVPAVDTFFHFASPRPGNPGSEMPAMIALPVLFAFLAIGLIASRTSEPTAEAT
ncbi:MAG: M20/M25/M40 family metallo-hydrolase [Actinomycetota bacterium]